ncbi:MAG: hypothetical protein JWO36_4871 [Myxococcales bacterium]|nr:hypothetical protein [Myxococcales bacterium]
MTRFGYTLSILAASALASACTDDVTAQTDPNPPGSTTGDQTSTFDHANDSISAWDLLDRLQKEGPPRYTSHVHSCPKVRYRTLSAVLKSLGVNVGNTTALSAGQLYTSGMNALGAPNYPNRIRENLSISTSGASREFDIFAAAADEVIAAVPTLTRCQVAGVGAQLFDTTSGACRPDGITCLIGQPATATHLSLCNLTVQNASDPTVGKRLAVATMLAAAYTCE